MSHENWRSLPWMQGVSSGLHCFIEVLHTSHDSRRSPEWMFGWFFKVSCCLRAFLWTSHEMATRSQLSDFTQLFCGSAISPFCCLTITWATSWSETVWKTRLTTAENHMHWYGVWNVWMYSSAVLDGRKWCVKKSAVYNWITDVNKHINMQDNVNTMWLTHKICVSSTSCFTRWYSHITWRSSFCSLYNTLYVFPMFHRNTLPHLPTETVWMCCGVNWHSYSRATEGSYTRPTLMGKHSVESNGAVKTECRHNSTQLYYLNMDKPSSKRYKQWY